jgi:hypothetical protein
LQRSFPGFQAVRRLRKEFEVAEYQYFRWFARFGAAFNKFKKKVKK